MINCCRNDEECRCGCHRNNDIHKIMHCAACCSRCPYCKLNIVSYKYDEHIIKCKGNNNEKNALNY